MKRYVMAAEPRFRYMQYANSCIAKASPEYTQPSASPEIRSGIIPTDPFKFKENPDAWLLVDKILQEASYPQTKCETQYLSMSRAVAEILRYRSPGLGQRYHDKVEGSPKGTTARLVMRSIASGNATKV